MSQLIDCLNTWLLPFLSFINKISTVGFSGRTLPLNKKNHCYTIRTITDTSLYQERMDEEIEK